MTKRLDVSRDDAGVRLRTTRLRRGMSQVALAEMAGVSSSFVSMVETGERHLRQARDVLALADVLRVSPRYLADGWEDPAARGSRALGTVPFPARCDPITLDRHQQLARHFIGLARSPSGLDRCNAVDIAARRGRLLPLTALVFHSWRSASLWRGMGEALVRS